MQLRSLVLPISLSTVRCIHHTSCALHQTFWEKNPDHKNVKLKGIVHPNVHQKSKL